MKFLVFLAGIGLISAGPATLTMPELAANTYGIPIATDEALGYLRATAIRDVALGGWLLSLLYLGSSRRTLAASTFSIAFVALGDAINVLFHDGSNPLPIFVHAGGLLVLIAIGVALWRSDKPSPKRTGNVSSD